MHRQTRITLAAGCVSLVALSVPALSLPSPREVEPSRVQLPQPRPKQIARPPLPTPKPKQAVLRPAPAPTQHAPVAEPVSLSARIKPAFGMPTLVAEARKYMGTNPTSRSRLWCATFMNMVLAKAGYSGTNSDAAKSFASYGRRISEPQIGAIAVLTRGKRGGHVGVVSGVDAHGNPIIISGNHNKRVGEAVYPRARVIAYVMPTGRGAPVTHVASSGPVSRPAPESGIESPIAELLAAIEAEQNRSARARLSEQNVAERIVPRPAPQAPVPHLTVQQLPEAPRPAPQRPQRVQPRVGRVAAVTTLPQPR